MAAQDLIVNQLTYYYPDAERPALDDLSWHVERGEFVLLVGPSGCGKSTLLRALNGLVPEFYGGQVRGDVLYRGKRLSEYGNRSIAKHIGMVFQDPEKQLVMTEVEREMAFGLENLLVPEGEMRRRVAEVMSFFDLTPLRQKRTSELSGGEKQKVAIAAVMALQPDVLLLDEPTSQLDPGAAQEILDLIKRLNEELGLTVVLVEQRLDRVLHLADRIVAMEDGRIAYDGAPDGFARYAAEQQTSLLTPVTKLFADSERTERPLTVKAARQIVSGLVETGAGEPAGIVKQEPDAGAPKSPFSMFLKRAKQMLRTGDQDRQDAVLEARQVRYSYEEGAEVLRGMNVQIPRGQLTAILGANGTGKSTLLRHFCALLHPQAGKVLFEGADLAQADAADLAGRIGYLSQNPGDYLFHDTLWSECEFSRGLVGFSTGDEATEQDMSAVLDSLGLLAYRDRNPRDLSGGERQRAALATVLVQKPRLLLLDEPTRGLDSGNKQRLGAWLSDFVADGGTVVLITHDVEFAAEYAGQVLLLDDGVRVAQGAPSDMLARGLFYAPQIGRVFRGVADEVVSLQDGVRLLRELTERQATVKGERRP